MRVFNFILSVFIAMLAFMSTEAGSAKFVDLETQTQDRGIEICTNSGTLLADFKKLVSAFNRESTLQAKSVNISGQEGKFNLFFSLENSTAAVYELEDHDGVQVFNSNSSGSSYTCEGSGCSSCKMQINAIDVIILGITCFCMEGEGSCSASISSSVTNVGPAEDVINAYYKNY